MKLYHQDINPDTLSPLTLAFLGDAVFSLFVRERLVCTANRPVGALHNLSVQAVKASAQAEGIKRILPLLTERELAVFKRGRNAHTSHTPKNQNGCDYHYATGLEALVGYLYLHDDNDRLRLLLDTLLSGFGVDENEENNP